MACIEAWVSEARECCGEGRLQQAQRLYTQALDALPAPLHHGQRILAAQIHNERGLCLYKQVCFDEAVKDYTQALELDPSLAAAYYNRGTIYYRLLAAHPRGSSEWEAHALQAMENFQEAVTLDPCNNEFREGMKSCRDEMNADDDDVKILNLENVPLRMMVKLLFLLDNGDEGTGSNDSYKQENAEAAWEAKETFHAILTSREKGYQEITDLLQRRAKKLFRHRSIILPKNTEAASLYSVRKQDEDLLILTESCHYLGIKYHHLDDKIKEVQEKMELEDNEKEGNFLIYAENLLMNRICDNLTSDLVYKLFCLAVNRDGWKFGHKIDSGIIDQKQLDEEGVKEALFFFTIRQMEGKMLLNRIYTDKLQKLFEELNESTGKSENLIMPIQELKNYPNECQPAGLCIVFCVTEDREGADSEIAKIRSVFEDSFKFTVKIEKNPKQSTLEEYYTRELVKTKYGFYDSLVIWFVSHGDETNLILAGKETYNREKFIDDFSLLRNFNKKPKVFFMATCRGSKPIRADELGRTDASPDVSTFWQDGPGGNQGHVNIPVSSQDISKIYYQMDRIIAYATLPSNVAFRVKDEGSIFVDTVCAVLEENQGQNITEVLEEVCRTIHQIVFRSEENKFKGESKQACFYESTFQKTCLVPRK